MSTDTPIEVAEWPAIPYAGWSDTLDTLHMCVQVVGKVRLALTPLEPEWGNVALFVTARGLTTSPMPTGAGTFEIDVDLVHHAIVVRMADARERAVPLTARPVSSFHRELTDALRSLGVDAHVWPVPVEIPDPIPFADDVVHHSYDADAVGRYFRALARVDLVMKRHRARFRGRTTPVHFFWGTFDLANTRFSGRPAAPPPNADSITRVSYDAEQISAGFWPGDARFPDPAFFSYAYPRPDGIESASVAPAAASWQEDLGLFVLPYDDVRGADSPDDDLLSFLSSTYDAAAALMGWDERLVRS